MLTLMVTQSLKHQLILINALLDSTGIVLLSLILGGCTSRSPGMPNLYLLRISGNNTEADFAHIGYLGICAHINGTLSCTTKAKGFAFHDVTKDSNPFVQSGIDLLSSHVFPLSLEAAALGAFILASLLTPWHLTRIKQTGRLALSVVVLSLQSAMLQFVALVGFWWASHALKHDSNHEVVMDRGKAIFWMQFTMVIYPLFLIIPSCSILIIERLTTRMRKKRDLPAVV